MLELLIEDGSFGIQVTIDPKVCCVVLQNDQDDGRIFLLPAEANRLADMLRTAAHSLSTGTYVMERPDRADLADES